VATILVVTLLTLFTFSARAMIYPGKKAVILHERATDDKFVVVLDKQGLGENEDEIGMIIREYGELEIKTA
jgi:hypothetical protein